MGPEVFIPIAFFVCATVIVRSILDYRQRRNELHAGRDRSVDLVAERFDRLEQAIDAIAVEVERVAEGQRYTTRLLSGESSAERGSGASVPSPGYDARSQRR